MRLLQEDQGEGDAWGMISAKGRRRPCANKACAGPLVLMAENGNSVTASRGPPAPLVRYRAVCRREEWA